MDVAAIVAALRDTPENARWQADGCVALATIVVGGIVGADDSVQAPSSRVDENVCARAASVGALVVITDAIIRHPTHAGVLHWGTTALMRLIHDSDERTDQAVAAGATEAVAAAVNHPDALAEGDRVAAKVMLAHKWLSAYVRAHGGAPSGLQGGENSRSTSSKAELIWMQLVRERATWDKTDSAYLGENVD